MRRSMVGAGVLALVLVGTVVVAPATAGAAPCKKTLVLPSDLELSSSDVDRSRLSSVQVEDDWDVNEARLRARVSEPVSGSSYLSELRGLGAGSAVRNRSNSQMVFNMSLTWSFEADVATAAAARGGWPAMAVPGTDALGAVDWRVDYEEGAPGALVETNLRKGRTESRPGSTGQDADSNSYDTSGTVSRTGFRVPVNTVKDFFWGVHMETSVSTAADGLGTASGEFGPGEGARLRVSAVTLTITSSHCWN